MTRSKERRLKEGFLLAVQTILNDLDEPIHQTCDDLSNAFAQLNITQGKQANEGRNVLDIDYAGTKEVQEALPEMLNPETIPEVRETFPEMVNPEALLEVVNKKVIEDLEDPSKEGGRAKAIPSGKNFTKIPRPTNHEPREVFTLFTICAGKMGQPSGS